MNGNYMMILQVVTMLMLIFLTGYFVYPHLQRPRVVVLIGFLSLIKTLMYEQNERLQIRDFTSFEKYQIWRFYERRKRSLVLLKR